MRYYNQQYPRYRRNADEEPKMRIAIFGEPGSGKTTIAGLLSRQLNCQVIEASEAVIYPLAALDFRFLSEERILDELTEFSSPPKPVSRDKALATFLKLQKIYSPEFIAKALHYLYVRPGKGSYIFSGLRGLDNARYCRLHNDFVVYLDADTDDLVDRLQRDRGLSPESALDELQREEEAYQTLDIKQVANLVVDTSSRSISQTVNKIISSVEAFNQMCKMCVNTGRNPSIKFNADGYCQVCSSYLENFDPRELNKELDILHSFKRGSGYDVMVGISGGKDSTATLKTIVDMGFNPLAFTFDNGYIPETTIPRSQQVAEMLGVDYIVIPTGNYIREIDRASYQKTAELYEEPFTLETKLRFQQAYAEGREHYSVKCHHSLPFVRTCQLCRRIVIRAYYGEAKRRNIPAIILGINEWTKLSSSGKFMVSGMRILQPNKSAEGIYIFHLPFLLQRNSVATKRILDELGWRPPEGEDFIESNSNSCLFARSTERMAKRLLGFHPDSTRLAREVTAGFITKRQALKALKKLHPYQYTPREVLERAGII